MNTRRPYMYSKFRSDRNVAFSIFIVVSHAAISHFMNTFGCDPRLPILCATTSRILVTHQIYILIILCTGNSNTTVETCDDKCMKRPKGDDMHVRVPFFLLNPTLPYYCLNFTSVELEH